MTEQEAPEKPLEEQAVEEAVEDEMLEEESERLPFPNARVVKIIKDNLKNDHQVKKEAKVAANELLGDIMAGIAQSMDREEFFTLSIEHFNRAARKYKEISLTEKRIFKIKKLLEKQRAEIDELIAEIELEHPDAPI